MSADVGGATERRAEQRLLARSFVWSLGGDGAAKAGVLVTALIAVRALDPVGFGIYLGFSATILLAASLWDSGVSTLLTREYAGGAVGTRAALTRAARLRLATLPAWCIVFGVGTVVLSREQPVSLVVIGLFALASLAFATHMLALGMLRARLRFAAAARALAFGRWTTTVLSAIALFTSSRDSAMTVLAGALVVGELVTLAVAAAAIARHASVHVLALDARRRLSLRAALPFAASSILNTAYQRFDVVILAALASTHQLSLYAPASRIQDAVYFFPAATAAIALPMVSRVWGTAEGRDAVRRLMGRLILLNAVLSILLTCVFFIKTRPIIGLILGSDYVGSTTATRILICALPFAAVATPLIAGLAGIGRAFDATRVFAAAFCVAIALHLALDWWLGATGAAIASFSREPVGAAVAFYYAWRAGILPSLRSRSRFQSILESLREQRAR